MTSPAVWIGFWLGGTARRRLPNPFLQSLQCFAYLIVKLFSIFGSCAVKVRGKLIKQAPRVRVGCD